MTFQERPLQSEGGSRRFPFRSPAYRSPGTGLLRVGRQHWADPSATGPASFLIAYLQALRLRNNIAPHGQGTTRV